MSIRQLAIPWLKSKNVSVREAIYTSKFYGAEESWTRKEVWWFVIPLKQIKNQNTIYLVCQVAPDSNQFYYFKVPTSFFSEHLEKFNKVADRIYIYLSGDRLDLFAEICGKGRLKFKQFLVSEN